MRLCLSPFILSFADSTANILQNDQLFVLIMMKMCMMPLFPHQKLYAESFTACQQTRIYYDLCLLWITCSLCDTIYVLLFSVKLTASMSISCLWPNDYRNDYFVKRKCIRISFHQNNRALAGLVLSCFNATFNNISAISWRSVLMVEETGVPGENRWPAASDWQTLSHNVASSAPRLSGIRTENVSGDRHRLHW
jgi:hypothetical protein